MCCPFLFFWLFVSLNNYILENRFRRVICVSVCRICLARTLFLLLFFFFFFPPPLFFARPLGRPKRPNNYTKICISRYSDDWNISAVYALCQNPAWNRTLKISFFTLSAFATYRSVPKTLGIWWSIFFLNILRKGDDLGEIAHEVPPLICISHVVHHFSQTRKQKNSFQGKNVVA